MNDKILVKYKKVIARLLEIAGEQFSNHVCEDFDLESILPEKEDRRELAKLIADTNDPEEYDPNENYKTMPESQLMLFFASVLDK
jgi:hypothetical protein